MTGRVKRLVKDRGFGFIQTDDGVEYFFHRSAVQGGRQRNMSGYDELEEGHRVSFDEEGSSKGPRATNVERM